MAATGQGTLGGARNAPTPRRSISLDSEEGWSSVVGAIGGEVSAGVEAFLLPEEEQVRAPNMCVFKVNAAAP